MLTMSNTTNNYDNLHSGRLSCVMESFPIGVYTGMCIWLLVFTMMSPCVTNTSSKSMLRHFNYMQVVRVHFKTALSTLAAIIIASPRSVTVCAGLIAEFTCVTGNGALLEWTVDGMAAYKMSVQARNINYTTSSYILNGTSGYKSTLTVYGSLANSNVSVRCNALPPQPNSQVFSSDAAILLVQGTRYSIDECVLLN